MSRPKAGKDFLAAGTADSATPRGEGALYMTESLVEIDGNPNLLGRLSPSERAIVVSCGTFRTYRRGDLVFQQGLPHDGIFLIENGRIRSFYVSPGGREITLAYWTPGHFVGGPAIFGDGEHMWTAKATERSNVLYLPGRQLKTLVQEVHSLSVGLIEALVYKAKCYSALLQVLGTKSVSKRLAHLILTMAERHGKPTSAGVEIEMTFTREELANMIGATRQWASVIIDRFHKEGLIVSGKGRVLILDLPRLLDLSE